MILYIGDEVLCDDIPQTRVEFLSMFADHHGVGTPVKLFKAQQAIVLILNGLEGILKDLPDAVCIPLIKSNLAKTKRCWFQWSNYSG